MSVCYNADIVNCTYARDFFGLLELSLTEESCTSGPYESNFMQVQVLSGAPSSSRTQKVCDDSLNSRTTLMSLLLSPKSQISGTPFLQKNPNPFLLEMGSDLLFMKSILISILRSCVVAILINFSTNLTLAKKLKVREFYSLTLFVF